MGKRVAIKSLLFACILGLLCLSSPAQSGYGVPSKGTITGAIVGIGAAIVVVVLIATHRHSTITGCVLSSGNGNSITDEKSKTTYNIVNGKSAVTLTVGERVKIKGKKKKDASGNSIFQIVSVEKDYGRCTP